MQTSAVAQRISSTAHSLNRKLPTDAGQIVVDDPRIRGWAVATNDSITQPSQVTSQTATAVAGGSLTASTAYNYAICTVKGTTQSLPVMVSGTTTGSNKKINLAWTAASGSPDSYNIYRITGTNYYAGLTFLANTASTSYSDDGTVTLTAGIPPMGIPYDFEVGIDEVPNLWRIRTLSNNTLQVQKATVSDTPSWSDVGTLNQSCIAGYGVSMYVTSSTNVIIFYCIPAASGQVTIQARTWNGSAWSVATSIITLANQGSGACVRLSAPNATTLFFTDSTTSGTVVKVTCFSTTWKTPATWDIGYQNIGLHNNGVTIPGWGNWFSTLSVVPVGSDYLMAFYADQPLGRYDRGIYTMFVSNVGVSGTATTAFWRTMNSIYPTNATAAKIVNSPFKGRELFLLNPRIQTMNSGYWINTMQASQFAGNVIQHFDYMYSPDGKHWSDHQPLAGSDYNSGLYTFYDLMYNKILVSGNRTFFFSYDKIYLTASTSLVGVTNTSKQIDLTADVPSWSYTRSPAGQSSTATLEIFNANGKYNLSSIIRRGSRLIRKVGYVTSTPGDLITYMTEIVTRVEQATKVTASGIQNIIRLTTQDYVAKLNKWVSDNFIEFFSGHHINIGTNSITATGTTYTSGFGDLTPVSVWNGTFFTAGGELHPGILDTNSNYNDNMCVINTQTGGQDGVIELRFKGISSWTGTYFGVAFQVTDNTNYYAVLYNANVSGSGANKFEVVKSSPNPISSAAGAKINSYALLAGFTPVSATFTNGTYYWLRVCQYHNTLSVYYSTDRQTWTLAFTNSTLPATNSLWGIIGKGNLTVALPVGQTGAVLNDGRYLAPLNEDGLGPLGKGGRLDLVVRISPGSSGILRSISVAMQRYQNGKTNLPPDAVIGIVKDNGSGTYPANLSVPSNILYTSTIGSNSVSFTGSWLNIPITESIQVNAGAYYWVWVHAYTSMTETQWYNSQSIYVAFYPGDSTSYPTYMDYYGTAETSTPNWVPYRTDLSASLSAVVYTSLNTAGPVFSNYNFSTGEFPATAEYVVSEISARSGLQASPTFDSVITDSFSSLNSGIDGSGDNWFNGVRGTWTASGVLSGYATTSQYGFLRSNSSKGLVDDTILDCDFKLLASTVRAGFVMRFLGDPSNITTCSGYYIEFQPQKSITGGTVDVINMYNVVAGVPSLIYTSPSNVPFPINTTFHVTIVNKAGFYQIYIWDALATQFFDTTIINLGYVGFGCYSNLSSAAVANWDNFRLPDIPEVKDYYAIQKGESGRNSLERLFGGNTQRIKYFARYDGSLYVSQFNNRTVSDTYESTMVSGNKTDSDDYWFSDVEASGETLYARRFAPDLLDSDSRRYRQQSIDVYTDTEGYNLEGAVIRSGEELASQYKFSSAANPCAEVEDVITITNALDQSNTNYIINDVQLNYSIKDGKFTQDIGCRLFIS